MVISCQTLVDKIKTYDANFDEGQFRKAYQFCKESHGTQKRASGDAYYSHPVEVAWILADMKLDQTSLITALLHDTVEDTHVTFKDIEENFGEEVRALVDGVTKLAKIEYQTEQKRQAENFRKLLVAMSEDIRVLLVKLADRLHNMRTLDFVKPEKRVRIAHETMEIYTPLAERIGMQKFKNELQDLSFAQLHPEARESIISRLEYLRKKGNAVVGNIHKEIEKILSSSNKKIKVDIIGREKTPASIWAKMERKNISFEQLSDIMAFRVITEDIATCYEVLGIFHTNFKMIPDRFKDFISTPKVNGYQSIHTVVIGPEQRFVEIQIRTHEMHDIAEYGVAAHWSYKQQKDYSTDGKQYKWVRELLYILENTNDSEEFLENTKLEMYYDQVFCFTPRGDLIDLPKGATPVDFAYEVHSDIGNHCAGAKINGRIMPLRTQLENGDQVEIITSDIQVPNPVWEEFVMTGKAKSQIKRFIRAQKTEEYTKLGKSLVAKKFKEAKKTIKVQDLKSICLQMGKKNVSEIYLLIGQGHLDANELLKKAYPKAKIKKRRNPLNILRLNKKKNSENQPIPLKGLIEGVAVSYAECCHPIPGDSIVGLLNQGKGMEVHTSDCEVLSNFVSKPENFVDISWDKGFKDDIHVGTIKAILMHESGSLAALSEVVAKGQGNIINIKINNRANDFFELTVDIGVKGTNQLNDIIKSLKANKMIQSVERYKKNKIDK